MDAGYVQVDAPDCVALTVEEYQNKLATEAQSAVSVRKVKARRQDRAQSHRIRIRQQIQMKQIQMKQIQMQQSCICFSKFLRS